VQSGTALFVVPDPVAALALLTLAQQCAGEGLSAFELISGTAFEFLAETMPQIRLPLRDAPKWMVLIDLGLAAGQDPSEMLSDIFARAQAAGNALDGVIAQSEAQRQDLWTMRESIPAANKIIGAIASHDISLPISTIPDYIKKTTKAVGDALGGVRINCFGHLGDGNLHFNIFPARGRSRTDYTDGGLVARRIVHDIVSEFDGSFSAEHGVGRTKVDDLERYGDPTKLAAMRAIKVALDPNGIMNPGAVLRS